MTRLPNPRVEVLIFQEVLNQIFDECDLRDDHETGGRLIGTFNQKDRKLSIEVSGVIGPGPAAKRTATSFFQDGEYQEKVFRSIEMQHRDIEHLGNWHTHHVNGYPDLSSGDVSTYRRTVNHIKHNTDFFYALLVVAKSPDGSGSRYLLKHYLLRRGTSEVYEIPSSSIRIESKKALHAFTDNSAGITQDLIDEFYPELKPFFSNKVGGLYWKGQIEMVDGSRRTLIITKEIDGSDFSIAPIGLNDESQEIIKPIVDRSYRSALSAIRHFENEFNKYLYSISHTESTK